jgi:putative transposase
MAFSGARSYEKTRVSEEQVAKVLHEADGAPVAEVAKKHGLAERALEIELMKEVAEKNNRRARAPSLGRLPSTGRPVDPASVRSDVSHKINVALPVASDQA